MRDTLHQATVTEEYPGSVIDDVEARLVELPGQHFLGQCHADCIRDALPEWPGRCFDRQIGIVFRVTCGSEPELPKISNLIHRQVIASQVQQAIQQH